MHIKKGEMFLLGFNLLYLLIFAIYYISIRNFEFLWYIFVVLFFIGLLGFNLRRLNLNYTALWGLSIWGLLHMLGGGVRINGTALYGLHILPVFDGGGDFFILKMDQIIHFYGFAVASIVVFQLLYPMLKSNAGVGKIVFLTWIGSMGLGALNEVVEFIAFIAIDNTGVGSLYNTGLDLIFNMLGAFVGAVFAYKMRDR